MMPPPVNIDPKDKAMIDALVDVSERARSRRAWRFWVSVAVLSLGAILCAGYEAIPGVVRGGLVIAGALGLLLFAVFLSTKSFGRGYYAGPSWWL